VTHQVAGALTFLHDTASIVHNDVKPENLLLRRGPPFSDSAAADGTNNNLVLDLVLGDFGCAQVFDMDKGPA